MNNNNPFVSALHPQGAVFYVGGFTKAGPISGGYYNDPMKACQDAMALDQKPNSQAVYMSVQPVKDYPPGQALNTQVKGCKPPKNEDIAHLYNYFIDIDPVRDSGTIATDQQVELVNKVGTQLHRDLSSSGFPEMMIQCSGNGIQMFGKIDMAVSQENIDLLKSATATLANHYGTNEVKFDLAIYNPARLCRFPGTTNRKGKETENLRYRKAEVLYVPTKQAIIDQEWMQRMAAQSAPTPVEQLIIENFSVNGLLKSDFTPRFNLTAYLSFYAINVVKIVKHGDVTLYVLDRCLFNPNHGYGKAAIGQRDDGTLLYFCFHDSCRGYQWQDARKSISGNVSLEKFWENGRGYEEMAGTVISMADLVTVNFPRTAPLVENIISVGGATVISGAGGVGKSNFALLLALVLGSPSITGYLDLKIAGHVSTLLVQAENAAADTKERVVSMSFYPELEAGLKHVYSPTQNGSDIRILDGDFNNDKFLTRVMDDIKTFGVGLLIIDPLISFYHGDENDNSTMRRFLDRLTLLMSLTGVAIIIIHHVGRGGASKDLSYAGRGASAVGDWAHNSFLLKVSDQKEGTLELSCQKARNFKKPEPIYLRMNQHLVFERVHLKGGFSQVHQQRIVINALMALGGHANTQQELTEAIRKSDSNINKTQAFNIIKSAVNDGSVVEIKNGRKMSYQLPQQQQIMSQPTQSALLTP